jgi:hypothetical protein
MITYALSLESVKGRRDFCIGLEVSPEPVDHPGLADLPRAAFDKLQEVSDSRADLHPASQCVIYGEAAAFKGRGATLLSYLDGDMEVDEHLRNRGIQVPERPARLSFEPNRLAPVDWAPSVDIRPDGRMQWDGYGQVGDSCGPRSYDFAGDARNVRILKVWQYPEIC